MPSAYPCASYLKTRSRLYSLCYLQAQRTKRYKGSKNWRTSQTNWRRNGKRANGIVSFNHERIERCGEPCHQAFTFRKQGRLSRRDRAGLAQFLWNFVLFLENSVSVVIFSYTSAFAYTLPFIANRRLIKDEIKYGPIENGFVQWYERKGISDGIIWNQRDFILVTSHRCKERTLLELLDIYGRGRWCMKTWEFDSRFYNLLISHSLRAGFT